jgi:hypothetical protein
VCHDQSRDCGLTHNLTNLSCMLQVDRQTSVSRYNIHTRGLRHPASGQTSTFWTRWYGAVSMQHVQQARILLKLFSGFVYRESGRVQSVKTNQPRRTDHQSSPLGWRPQPSFDSHQLGCRGPYRSAAPGHAHLPRGSAVISRLCGDSDGSDGSHLIACHTRHCCL